MEQYDEAGEVVMALTMISWKQIYSSFEECANAAAAELLRAVGPLFGG
jgi:hypothetical protein